MKFCYIDESGISNEPYLVMVGVIVDAKRMHRTKEMWGDFLTMLTKICRRKISEFHTRDFYAGNGPWRGIDGPERARIISAVLNWWGKGKHHLTFTAIDKEVFNNMKCNKELFQGCEKIWQVAAIHIALTIQKNHQSISNNKGHTLLLFDRESREENQFSNFISKPLGWTDNYYDRKTKQAQFDQIIDMPFFGDSQQVLLLQVADIIAFILRRYAEIKEGKDNVRYKDEMYRLTSWIDLIKERFYTSSCRWPSKGINDVQRMFNKLVPNSLKVLK